MSENRDIRPASPAPTGFSGGRAGALLKSTLGAVLLLVPAACDRSKEGVAVGPSDRSAETEQKIAKTKLDQRGALFYLVGKALRNANLDLGPEDRIAVPDHDALRSLFAETDVTPETIYEKTSTLALSPVQKKAVANGIWPLLRLYRFNACRQETIRAALAYGPHATPQELAETACAYVRSKMKYDALQAAASARDLGKYRSSPECAATLSHIELIREAYGKIDASQIANKELGEIVAYAKSPEATPEGLKAFLFDGASRPGEKGPDFRKAAGLLLRPGLGIGDYDGVRELADILEIGRGDCADYAEAVRQLYNASAEALGKRAAENAGLFRASKMLQIGTPGHAFNVLVTPEGETRYDASRVGSPSLVPAEEAMPELEFWAKIPGKAPDAA